MKKLTLAALASAALLATISFGAAPAYAMGCSDHADVAMSCAAGATWDADKKTCVPTPTG